jgi:L-seryl-tRNA(Ser) seleniumtransferase
VTGRRDPLGKTDAMNQEALRKIPSLDALLRQEEGLALIEEFGRETASRAARGVLEETRAKIRESAATPRPAPADGSPSPSPDASREALLALVRARLESRFSASLRPAINATGIIMHSGLGRAVLSDAACAALQSVGRGYSNLALDLDAGKRTTRDIHVESLLREITGAEAATVVNNNSAATVIILNTLARGKEAIVSRGQLVEIGGSFRMPEVMKTSGAVLREVGTTNKTHLRDYEEAVGEATGAIVHVHHSNYRIMGFFEEPGIGELAELGRRHGVPVVDDLGSGALVDLAAYGIESEPMVQTSLRAGADLVCFSGDKLIGGPQSGIILGKAAWIQKIKKNPLARAFRCGKLTLAALEATLKLFLAPEKLRDRHPVYRMFSLTPEDIGRRAKKAAQTLRKNLPDLAVSVEPGESQVGSGAVPVETLRTKVLALKATNVSAEELSKKLRRAEPPVFARILKDTLLFDFRTIQPGEDAVLVRILVDLLK